LATYPEDETAGRQTAAIKDCLSPKEVAESRKIFRASDKDGSGFFDHEEFAVLASTGGEYNQIQP